MQGTLVAYANVPAFIVTLGGLLIWRGVIKGISRGSTIPIGLSSFKVIGQNYVSPIVGIVIAVIAIAKNTVAYPGITCESPPNSETLRVCRRS